jgi:hypothetical protein
MEGGKEEINKKLSNNKTTRNEKHMLSKMLERKCDELNTEQRKA